MDVPREQVLEAMAQALVSALSQPGSPAVPPPTLRKLRSLLGEATALIDQQLRGPPHGGLRNHGHSNGKGQGFSIPFSSSGFSFQHPPMPPVATPSPLPHPMLVPTPPTPNGSSSGAGRVFPLTIAAVARDTELLPFSGQSAKLSPPDSNGSAPTTPGYSSSSVALLPPPRSLSPMPDLGVSNNSSRRESSTASNASSSTTSPRTQRFQPSALLRCVLGVLANDSEARANFTAGWAALREIWNIVPSDMDAAVLAELALKPALAQDELLLGFAAVDLSEIRNLSAYLTSVMKEHEAYPHVCLRSLVGLCEAGPAAEEGGNGGVGVSGCGLVHVLEGSAGWD
eukprot:RCo033327